MPVVELVSEESLTMSLRRMIPLGGTMVAKKQGTNRSTPAALAAFARGDLGRQASQIDSRNDDV